MQGYPDRRRSRSADVLVSDGHYMHCGERMAATGAEMRTIHGTYNSAHLPETLGVYLATRVLRCACGFQIEIPDQESPVLD